MEPTRGKPGILRNILVRTCLFLVFIISFRFAFCFLSLPESFTLIAGDGAGQLTAAPATGSATTGPTTEEWRRSVGFYSSVFQDLMIEGFISPKSKSLCLETPIGDDVSALQAIGVRDSIGISKKARKPWVISGQAISQPFDDNTFDFVFSGGGAANKSPSPAKFAAEIGRTLKPEGFFVIHTLSKDTYSFNSFIDLFNCCTFIRSRQIEEGFSEIVMKKETLTLTLTLTQLEFKPTNICSVPGYKLEIVRKAEPIIAIEPSKPWITLKQNLKHIKYLSAMADISFKHRYIYVDVGARSYGSSIVSWFKKQYPKQNKTFDIYAIEADKTFHDEYQYKKGVTLIPLAAWLKNETLFFEINRDPGAEEHEAKGLGMGRIQPSQSSASSASHVDTIQGFDFSNWLKSTVTERDFVVMKMDVEGTEFHLIPKLFETGAICLIDEIFLECHYNRWQKCCPGVRSAKYEKTYGQCLELFNSLRRAGVLVHQWW